MTQQIQFTFTTYPNYASTTFKTTCIHSVLHELFCHVKSYPYNEHTIQITSLSNTATFPVLLETFNYNHYEGTLVSKTTQMSYNISKKNDLLNFIDLYSAVPNRYDRLLENTVFSLSNEIGNSLDKSTSVQNENSTKKIMDKIDEIMNFMNNPITNEMKDVNPDIQSNVLNDILPFIRHLNIHDQFETMMQSQTNNNNNPTSTSPMPNPNVDSPEETIVNKFTNFLNGALMKTIKESQTSNSNASENTTDTPSDNNNTCEVSFQLKNIDSSTRSEFLKLMTELMSFKSNKSSGTEENNNGTQENNNLDTDKYTFEKTRKNDEDEDNEEDNLEALDKYLDKNKEQQNVSTSATATTHDHDETHDQNNNKNHQQVTFKKEYTDIQRSIYISERDFTFSQIFNNLFTKQCITWAGIPAGFIAKFVAYLFLKGYDVNGELTGNNYLKPLVNACYSENGDLTGTNYGIVPNNNIDSEYHLFQLLYSSLTDEDFELPEDDFEYNLFLEFNKFINTLPEELNFIDSREMFGEINKDDYSMFYQDETSNNGSDNEME